MSSAKIDVRRDRVSNAIIIETDGIHRFYMDDEDAHTTWLKLGEFLYNGKPIEPRPIQAGELVLHPRGCICPPDANRSCQAPMCPRQALTIT